MARRGPWRMYDDLAPWWPLLSAPADYAEEAGLFLGAMARALGRRPGSILELGSGGGNNASHMKGGRDLVLVDVSPGMLRVSRRLKPECAHRRGDMRRVRLGRTFDAVFVHDAASYLRTAQDVRATARTAAEHLGPRGVALLVPDWTRETFREEVSTGGHDGGGRSMRYLAWTRAGGKSACATEYAFLLRERGGRTRMVADTHRHGLFPRALWLAALREAGFRARALPFRHSTFPRGDRREMFLGIRRPQEPRRRAPTLRPGTSAPPWGG